MLVFQYFDGKEKGGSACHGTALNHGSDCSGVIDSDRDAIAPHFHLCRHLNSVPVFLAALLLDHPDLAHFI